MGAANCTSDEKKAPVGCVKPNFRRGDHGTACPLESSAVFDPREPPLLISVLYLVLRELIEPAVLRPRSAELKELEIIALRHELGILRPASQSARTTASRSLLLGGERSSTASMAQLRR